VTRAWLAILLVASGCANTPPRPAERTPAAAKGSELQCSAPQDDTIVDGLVVLRPGETVCIAATSLGDAVALAGAVATSDDAARPIMIRSWREGSEVYMTIRNPFSRALKYRAGVVLPGEVRPRDTTTCPALSDYRPTLEHWPHPVDEILLTDFWLLAAGAYPARERR
jgi:hypothetical protein